MTYLADKVFPLSDVYNFAQRVGGQFASLISAIRNWKQYPDALLSYESFSQARRALCYLALQQDGLWDQFVTECWPTANTPSAKAIIEELQRDFINNDLLARNRHALPPEAGRLRLPEPRETPSANDASRGEGAAGGQLQHPPPEPPAPDGGRRTRRGGSLLLRVLIGAAKAFAVAIISALGAKLGGWIGAVIAATIAGALAVVTPIEPGGGSQGHHT